MLRPLQLLITSKVFGAEHSTGYIHSLKHGTENLLTLHFNGKISKRVILARTNVSSLKMVHMD
jgi:hypothetical protein